MNVVVVQGRLSRDPEVRPLPSGDEAVGLEVTVAAVGGTRAESVPVSWVGAPAWVLVLTAGDEVVITGRVRRRFFRTASGTASRTEVVAEQGAPTANARRARELVSRVGRTLTASGGAARREKPLRRQ
jgi:single-strand DNA-binding protein